MASPCLTIAGDNNSKTDRKLKVVRNDSKQRRNVRGARFCIAMEKRITRAHNAIPLG